MPENHGEEILAVISSLDFDHQRRRSRSLRARYVLLEKQSNASFVYWNKRSSRALIYLNLLLSLETGMRFVTLKASCES